MALCQLIRRQVYENNYMDWIPSFDLIGVQGPCFKYNYTVG